MQNPLPSATAISFVPSVGIISHDTANTPFPGELVTFDYDGKSWAQQEYEKDHKGWQSLGRIDQD